MLGQGPLDGSAEICMLACAAAAVKAITGDLKVPELFGFKTTCAIV
jgi:hypothetical protein